MSVGFHSLRRFSWLVALSLAPGALFASELTGIRLSSSPVATRIVFDLDRPFSHSLLELGDPNRVVIDLEDTVAGTALHLPLPKGRVRSVRTGTQSDGTFRVVLDLTEAARSTSFVLPPEGGYGHRLVIDLSKAAGSAPTRRTVDERTDRDTVVVIDAGHGGKDPGATGRNGVREKQVVLQIATRLAALVDAAPGLRAVLVRDDDRFVELSERLRIAHEAQADFFISIHADWNDDSRLNGATVYSIQTGRAESEVAKRLADRENAAHLVGGENISGRETDLARILLDLSLKASMSKSNIAGRYLLDRLGDVTTLRKPQVEQGNLYVLTSPDIPSLLIETAFVSNAREAERLRDSAFQEQLARAIFAGIVDFYRDYPPPGSYLARNPPPETVNPIRHVIARGETLSEIAERYRVSLRELRRTNEIASDIIRIGQVLTIPR